MERKSITKFVISSLVTLGAISGCETTYPSSYNPAYIPPTRVYVEPHPVIVPVPRPVHVPVYSPQIYHHSPRIYHHPSPSFHHSPSFRVPQIHHQRFPQHYQAPQHSPTNQIQRQRVKEGVRFTHPIFNQNRR
jgi:hypothetical protein